jgi:hypothetical protein
VVYLNQGIPAVIFVTWPDMWYHSSHDTPDKLDPTQFKRVAVVGVASMSVLATAEDTLAAKVTAENVARGTSRLGQAQRKGMAYLADAATPGELVEAYKEARVAVRHQTWVEREVVRSSSVLYASPADAEKKLASLTALIEQRGAALEAEAKAFYQLRAAQMNAAADEPKATEPEAQAARLIPERTAAPGGGPGPGGPGGPQQQLAQLSAEERAAVQAALRKVPPHMTAELNALMAQQATRKRTVLEIRDFLSGEFEPVPIEDMMGYFRAQERIGQVKFTEKAPEPPPATPKKAPRKRS